MTGPELIPIWQDHPDARWLVTHTASHDPDDPWSGWLDVNADATDRTVEIGGEQLTPDEARLVARALMAAADHAEHYQRRTADTLFDLICPGGWPELDGLPTEQQRAARKLVEAAYHRINRRAVAQDERPV